MAYNNQKGGNNSGYDPKLDIYLYKGCVKSEKRYINVHVAAYNNKPPAIRLRPVNFNTNPDAKPNEKYVNMPGINGITKEEANQLIAELQKAVKEL